MVSGWGWLHQTGPYPKANKFTERLLTAKMPKKEILLQVNNEEQLNELCQRIVDSLFNNGYVARQGHYGLTKTQTLLAIKEAVLNNKNPLPELDRLIYLSWNAKDDSPDCQLLVNDIDVEIWNKALEGKNYWNIDVLFSDEEIESIDFFIRGAISREKELNEYPNKRKEASRYIQNPKVRERILQKYNNKCMWCGATDNLTIDHINPVKLGGDNSDKNLQVLCRSCNSCKGCKKGKRK